MLYTMRPGSEAVAIISSSLGKADVVIVREWCTKYVWHTSPITVLVDYENRKMSTIVNVGGRRLFVSSVQRLRQLYPP